LVLATQALLMEPGHRTMIVRDGDASAERRLGDRRYPEAGGLLPEPIASARPAKARGFRQAAGLQQGDAARLPAALLEAAPAGEAVAVATDPWGTHWRLDVTIRRHRKSVVVRTIRIVRSGEDLPRLVTCWML